MSIDIVLTGRESLRIAASATPSDGHSWQMRHNLAVSCPSLVGECIAPIVRNWARYAEEHETRYESKLSADYVLGPAWRDIGLSLRTLLNGVTGRLDCGTVDAFILDTLAGAGFDVSNL